MGRLSPADFHTTSAFAAAIWRSWSGLSLHHDAGVVRRFRRCPSSLYTFPCSGLGSGLPRIEVSPTLSSSASPVSQASTQVFLKSAAYAIPPRPRAAVLFMIGHVPQFYTSVGWHTFRHSYSTLLRANGADVKVQSELLRHSNIGTTLNLYTQAVSDQKRTAHGQVVGQLLAV